MNHPSSSLRLLSSLLGAVLLAACASHDDATSGAVGATTSALLDGTLDTTHTFSVGICQGIPKPNGDCVVTVDGQETSPDCSGTLIAPNLVLTARHCVAGLKDAPEDTAFCDYEFATPDDAATIKVTTGNSNLGATWLDVAEIRVPTATGKGTGCNDDVALLILKDPVPAAVATPADVDVTTNLAVTPPAAIAIIGRGWTAEKIDPSTGETLSFEEGGVQRRILENIPFVCASDSDNECSVLDSTSAGNVFSLLNGNFAAGPAASHHDSGSGILDQTRFTAGKPTVVGITYAGTYTLEGTNSATLGVRASYHHDFLIEGATAAAKIGGYAAPAWANSTAGGNGGSGGSGGREQGAGSGGQTAGSGGASSSGAGGSDEDSGSSCSMSPRRSTSFGGLGLLLATSALVRRRRAR